MEAIAQAEKVIPTSNVVQSVNSQMPQIKKALLVDASVDSYLHTIIAKDPGNLKDKSKIVFTCHATEGYFTDLNGFYLDMEMRLTDATLIRRAGQNNAEAYFINNIGQTVFKEILVFVNGVNVQYTYLNSQIRNVVQLLTTKNQDVEDFGILQGAFL